VAASYYEQLEDFFGKDLFRGIEKTRLSTQTGNMVNLLGMADMEVAGAWAALKRMSEYPEKGTAGHKEAVRQLVRSFMGSPRKARHKAETRFTVRNRLGHSGSNPVFGDLPLEGNTGKTRMGLLSSAEKERRRYQAAAKMASMRRTGLYDMIEFIRRNASKLRYLR
jgi:hypothetical protein